jgi:hypothetical protein
MASPNHAWLPAILEATGDYPGARLFGVRSRAFRPSDGAQNRIQTLSFHGPEVSGAFPCSGRWLARPKPSCRLDKGVTVTNPSLRSVMRATMIDGTPNGPALPMQSRLRGCPSRKERRTGQSRFCGRFCNTALARILQFIVLGDLAIALHPNQAYKNITGTLRTRLSPVSRTAFLARAIPAMRKAIGGSLDNG